MNKTISMKEWVSSVMSSEKRQAIPIMTHPGIELMGKKVIDAVTDAKIHFQAIYAMNEYFPAAASTVIMDLTVEAEAFGSIINFDEDEVPSVAGPLVHDLKSVEELKIPAITQGRVPEYIEAARLSAAHITNKPVFAGCIGPFSLAGRLFDMTRILTAIYMEPDTILELVKKCTIFIAEYVKALKATGANGIIMAEPAAGLLPPEMCDMFSSAFIKDIVEEVQDDDFLFILHNCGRTSHLLKSMLYTGAGALHLGNAADIVSALEEIPSDILVLGNLDPVGVFKNSRPDEVERATLDLMEQTRGKRNFIISSGCDTPPGVPYANIRAFYNALHRYHLSNFASAMDEGSTRVVYDSFLA
jgi:uroporphyrinogen decarboxylase